MDWYFFVPGQIEEGALNARKSLPKRIGQLMISLAVVWLLTFKILPFITSMSATTRQLAEFIDASGIETGQFYYTGVEIVTTAESGARGAVFFTNHKKELNIIPDLLP